MLELRSGRVQSRRVAMATTADPPSQTLMGLQQPLTLFYKHLHDAIREELGVIMNLASDFLSRGSSGSAEYLSAVSILRKKNHFLEFVYKYHSTIEDEVLYPVLEAKIKNVTLAYSVEHEDEEYLLEGLSALLAQASDLGRVDGDGAGGGGHSGSKSKAEDIESFVHGLARKVEEVNTTLRKHLDKEEEQLLPLLRDQFTIQEQSDLVVQFMCCIPVSDMTRMLKWLFRRLRCDTAAWAGGAGKRKHPGSAAQGGHGAYVVGMAAGAAFVVGKGGDVVSRGAGADVLCRGRQEEK